MVSCLNHYRRAARIYDRILNEYPETDAASAQDGDLSGRDRRGHEIVQDQVQAQNPRPLCHEINTQ